VQQRQLLPVMWRHVTCSEVCHQHVSLKVPLQGSWPALRASDVTAGDQMVWLCSERLAPEALVDCADATHMVTLPASAALPSCFDGSSAAHRQLTFEVGHIPPQLVLTTHERRVAPVSTCHASWLTDYRFCKQS